MLNVDVSSLPPQSIGAERAVLGALLIEGTAGYRRLALLTRPDQFWVDANRVVFTAMQRLDGRGSAIDVLLVTEELQRMGELDRIGGQAFLAGLEAEAAILANLPDYELIVADQASRRALDELGQRLTYQSRNGTTTEAILSMAETALAGCRFRKPLRRDSAPTELSALLAHRFAPRADIIGHGILPRRSLAVMGGRSFTGKSLLADNFILQRARGRPWLGFPTDPGVSLICSCEIPPEGAARRFRTMLGDESIPEGAIHLRTERGVKLDTPDGLAIVAGWIEETGANLLRLDPLARYMSSDENSTRDMGRCVDGLESLADRYDLGVLVIHHVGHAQKDSPRTGGDRLRGATALFAAADTVAMLDKEGDAYRLSWELRHAHSPESQRLTRDDSLWYHPAGLSDEDTATGKIVALVGLTHKALIGALREDTGVSESTAKRRVNAALASRALEKNADGLYVAGPAFTAEGSQVHGGSLGD